MTKRINKLAKKVIEMKKSITINEAMVLVLGEYNQRTANDYQDLFDAVEKLQQSTDYPLAV